MLVFYSSEINGLVNSITQFITYFNLVEAGLAGATVYALYKPLADNDYDEVSAIVVASKRFYFYAGFAFLALISLLALSYPFLIDVLSLSKLEVGLLVFVLGSSSILEFFTLAKYRALLSADQKTYVISIASTVHVILNTVLIYALSPLHLNIVFLRTIALLSIFARTAILVIYVRKKYMRINFNAPAKMNALNKRWDAMYMQILGAIHTGAPIVILTTVVKDLLLVSVFSVYNMITAGLHGVMSIFSSGLSASFGDVIVRKQDNILKETYQEFEVLYIGIITIVYSIAMVVIMPFIKLYTSGITDVNYYRPIVGFLIILNAFLFHLKSPQAMMLIAAGLYKESRIQTTIQGGLMVVLGVLFGYIWKIEGVLIASIISNVYRDIDLLFFIPHNVTHLPVGFTLKRWGWSIICFAIVVGVFGCINVTITSYLSWALWSIIVGLFALITVLSAILVFDRAPFLGLLKRLKGALFNK